MLEIIRQIVNIFTDNRKKQSDYEKRLSVKTDAKSSVLGSKIRRK